MNNKNKDEAAVPNHSANITLFAIILVGLVIAIAAGRLKSSPEDVTTESGSSTLAFVIPWTLVGILSIVLFIIYRLMNTQKPSTILKFNDAVYLTEMNRLGDAEASLREVEPLLSKDEGLKKLWQSQMASIEFERGNFQSACATYQEILSADTVKNDPIKQTYWSYVGTLAQFAAQSGDIALAESTLELGRGCYMIDKQGALLRAQVILLVRKKDYAGAAHLAQQDWRLADTGLTISQRNRYRVVWAFALQQLDAQKNAEQIANLVAGVKPFWKGQFFPLTHNWPEMVAFVSQHKLTDDYATA